MTEFNVNESEGIMVKKFHTNKATKFTVLFDRLFLKYTVARMGPIGAVNKLLLL